MDGVRIVLDNAELTRLARKYSTPDRIDIAEEVAHEAIEDAPVLTGEYRGGVSVQVKGDDVSVVDDDPESMWKEYGTVDTPAHAALTDAARRHGKYTGMQPKGR